MSPITPGKFARTQPVTAGQLTTQKPSDRANDRKTGALLRDLEQTKLEGDPLLLYGRLGEDAPITGTAPVMGGPPVSAADADPVSDGDRLVFNNSTFGAYNLKQAIGVDDDGELWLQSSGLGSSLAFYVGNVGGTPTRRVTIDSDGQMRIGASAPSSLTHLQVDGWFNVNSTGTLSGSLSIPWQLTLGDASGGAITATLPLPSTVPGAVFTIKRINAGAAVVVDTAGAETIDGAASKSLDTQYACLVVQSDGTNWHIVSTFGTVT